MLPAPAPTSRQRLPRRSMRSRIRRVVNSSSSADSPTCWLPEGSLRLSNGYGLPGTSATDVTCNLPLGLGREVEVDDLVRRQARREEVERLQRCDGTSHPGLVERAHRLTRIGTERV